MRELGVLPGMDWSSARDISDQGHVVGYSGRNGSAFGRAVLWTEIEGIRDLGTLPASDRTESGALAVNWFGQAVGYSWNGSAYRPVLFPTPR
jgi:probable HAF family extracellular repeat protein